MALKIGVEVTLRNQTLSVLFMRVGNPLVAMEARGIIRHFDAITCYASSSRKLFACAAETGIRVERARLFQDPFVTSF